MIKTLARSIREYKTLSILTPLLVTVEVIMECAIPFVIANLVNEMQAGCGMDVIVRYGVEGLLSWRSSRWFSAWRPAIPVRPRPPALQEPAQGYVLQDPGLFL